jgi:acetyltransferase-like isoleucine patch superfamily enzyme
MTIFGNRDRVHLNTKENMVNTLFNTSSGEIFVDEYTFSGHNVCLLTGTHDYTKKNEKRLLNPDSGRDIHIGKGVWLCSNVTVLGPCNIGDNAVIAAGAVVTSNTIIPSGEIWGGVPAKFIKRIEFEEET